MRRLFPDRDAQARLAEQRDRFASLLDVLGEHVYLAIVLEDGVIEEIFQGPGADRLLGGAEPDAAMVHWEAALHPDDRAAYDEFNRRLGQGEPAEVEYRLRGEDGITRWVHDRAATRRRDDGLIEISGIVSDVTERRRLQDELRRSARTDALTGVHNRAHFAERAEARLAERPHGFVLLDADHFKQVNDSHGHAVGDAVLVELAARLRDALEPGDCLGRWGGEEFAALLAGVASDGELKVRAERLRVAVAERPFTAGAIEIEQTISLGAVRGQGSLDVLAEAADRRLYAAKRLGRNRVSLMADAPAPATAAREPEGLGMARALAYAAGLRDEQPEAHASEVSLYATLIAERLGLPEATVWRCRLGGWLHDVGKVAIPGSILDKPGPLDGPEWQLMCSHPVAGAGIVARFAQLRDAAAAVRHHHERFDGSGYPDGLAGDAIPLEARIIAAADAYSAMTSARPYSPALTPAEAGTELRAAAGSQLDPEIVATLIEVLGSVVLPSRAARSPRPGAA